MATFINFGALMTKKDRDSEGKLQYYIKLDKEVKLVVNGKATTSEYIQVKAPTAKYDAMLAKDKITEEECDEKKARFAKGGDLEFIRQELTVIID
tara:strand:+ start:359 stop:643 length:285 start_codon:yes stop_codon:yes gene_type:complete